MRKIASLLVVLLLMSLVLPMAVGAQNPTEGSLTIHKLAQEPGEDKREHDGSELDEEDYVGKAISGVTYSIQQTHSYDPTNDKWEEINDGFTDAKTTGEEGQIKFENLQLGRYAIQETDWPDNVNGSDQIYYVDIPMTNKEGTKVEYDVHVYPKNELIYGNVKLIKKDGDSKDPLKGVKFKLYNAEDTKVGTYQTGPGGKIEVEGLAHGSYYFKEISTREGYVLGDQRVEFDIEESNVTVPVKVFNFVEPDIEKTVDETAVNRGEKVTYSLDLKLPGDIEDYNQFTITDVLDENLTFNDSWSVTGVSEDAFDFSANGQTLTWNVVDFNAFDGSEVTITFGATVNLDAPANEPIENKATLEFKNQFDHGGTKDTTPSTVTPTVGYLKLIKQDGDTQEKLEGAEFELVNVETGEDFNGSTDENGFLDFGELDYGTYELTETKAPMYEDDEGNMKPYNLLNNSKTIVIDAQNNDLEFTIDNYKSGWELPLTGGIGTSLFTLVGLVLMTVASYLYYRRNRGEAV